MDAPVVSDSGVRVSVTRVADLVCRQGDLDRGGLHGPTALQGQIAHRRIQQNAVGDSEVTLDHQCHIGAQVVTLTGRVDLLQRERRRVIEIKSTMVPAARLPESRVAHYWSQSMLYGWLLAESLSSEQALDDDECIQLELLLVNLRSGQEERLTREYAIHDLRCHGQEALTRYLVWLDRVENARQALRTSAVNLPFPHDGFRTGQRDMAAAIYRIARDGGTLLCEAPTGIGKTISSLFAGARALGEGQVDQVFYLTAKTSGQQSALLALKRLEAAGLQAFVLPIRSRRHACFCLNGELSPEPGEPCPMTIGFHDRLSPARDELFGHGVVDGNTLDDIARRHRLCPSAFTQFMLPWASIVVCDYNYVFDPLVRLGHSFDDDGAVLVLVDEAHNLVERGRDMYSARLDRLGCLDLAHACRATEPLLARRLESLASQLSTLGRSASGPDDTRETVPQAVLRATNRVLEAILESSGESGLPPVGGTSVVKGIDEPLQWFNDLLRFRLIGELHGQAHRTLVEQSSVGRRRQVTVRLRCLDAAGLLESYYKPCKAVALFSATLYPDGFFRDALGLPESTPYLRIASPFDARQVLFCHADWIDTRYRERAGSLDGLVDVIRRLALSREGNYLVFLPSYQYLEQVHTEFQQSCPDIETWVQRRGQSASEQQTLLSRLSLPGLRVGFAIMGGSLGEGVDYVGDLLIGLVIVGTGLPPHSEERDLIADCYRRRGLHGYDFAYRYPGFHRVLQASGRLIRDERDHGVVLLVDQRFASAAYRSLYPPHWTLERSADACSLSHRLQAFWSAVSSSSG